MTLSRSVTFASPVSSAESFDAAFQMPVSKTTATVMIAQTAPIVRAVPAFISHSTMTVSPREVHFGGCSGSPK